MSERFVSSLPRRGASSYVHLSLVRPHPEWIGQPAEAPSNPGQAGGFAKAAAYRLVLALGVVLALLIADQTLAQSAEVEANTTDGVSPAPSLDDTQLEPAEFDLGSENEDESEEDDFDAFSGIETIEISGKRGQGVDVDTAESVTAFDADDLAALGISDIADISQVTPNLEIRVSGATNANFFIRGVGLADFSANAASAVAIYQDNVALNSPAIQLGQIFDVDGIEVLRGPQGGGSGRNATAGAIKISSRKPTGTFSAELKATTGRYQSNEARNALIQSYEGAIEMPIKGDELSTRLAFRIQANDPYQYNGCGGLPEIPDSGAIVPGRPLNQLGPAPFDPLAAPFESDGKTHTYRPIALSELVREGISLCGGLSIDGPKYVLDVANFFPGERFYWAPGLFDETPAGLPSAVGDKGNWAVRNQIRYQPLDAAVDMDWILNIHGGRVDQHSTLGQAIGTEEPYVSPGNGWDVGRIQTTDVRSQFGGSVGTTASNTGGGLYTERDVEEELISLFEQAAAARGIDKHTATRNDPDVIAAKTEAFQALQQNLSSRPLDFGPYRGDYNRVGQTKLDTWGTSLNGQLYFDALEVHSITGYEGYDRYRETDQDFTSLQLFEAKMTDSAWQVSQEIQATGENESGLFTWDLGGYFLYEELTFLNHQFVYAESLGGAQEWLRGFDQETMAFAFNAGFSWEIVEDLILEVGTRYNWERKDFSLSISRPSGDATEIRGNTWSEPTGTIGLVYRIDDDKAAYWKFGHGFKAGHFNSIDIDDPPAGPEFIDSVEAGFRGFFFDSRLSMDGAIFYYEYTDYQVFLFDDQAFNPPSLAIKNARDTEQYGAEFNFTAEPLRDLVADEWSGLSITGRFSWLQSRFLDFTNRRTANVINEGIVTEIIDYSGNSLPNSPNYKFSGTVEWPFDFGSLGVFIPRYDFSWTDDLFFDPSNGIGVSKNKEGGFGKLPELALGQAAYMIHNFRLSYRNPTSTAEISLWARNLTDERYKSYGFDATTYRNVILNFIGEPRSFGIDLALNF